MFYEIKSSNRACVRSVINQFTRTILFLVWFCVCVVAANGSDGVMLTTERTVEKNVEEMGRFLWKFANNLLLMAVACGEANE